MSPSHPNPYPTPRLTPPADGGSTMPLILGFTVLALLVTAGAVAAGQAFVQQRDLQAVCDGAAVAAAASAADLDRLDPVTDGPTLRFAGVPAAVQAYLDRDPDHADVQIRAALSPDATTITLRCTEVRPIAFGAVFGRPHGIAHTTVSTARAPVR